MKVQSVRKLEKQARKYSNAHPVKMPDEWNEEYKKTHEEFLEVRKPMIEIQNKFCGSCWDNEVSCTCHEHPDYADVYNRLMPLEIKLYNMSHEEYKLQETLYHRELSNLLKMRKAKLEYLTKRQNLVG